MGIEYVAERYGAATVHIIVTGLEGQTGGSGFFSADYPGRVVTAGHVLRGREILRIENARREVIARPPFETLLGVEELDLGMIACVCPAGINPIQIEWRRALIRPMDSLLVLGFPPYPNRLPALDHSPAHLHQVTQDFRGERDSLVISSITRQGSSGGPVLSRRGRAIGVVDQENFAERMAGLRVNFFTATPARYCAELLEGRDVAGT